MSWDTSTAKKVGTNMDAGVFAAAIGPTRAAEGIGKRKGPPLSPARLLGPLRALSYAPLRARKAVKGRVPMHGPAISTT